MSQDPVSPVLQDIFLMLQPFIAQHTGLDPSVVIQGLPNRTAMPPASPGFCAMTIVHRGRLNTNIDTWDESDPDPTTVSSEMHAKVTVQLDFYGAGSFDQSAIIETLWRDEIACTALAPTCQPLYTGDPILAPLDDTEEQYEQRWILEAVLQYNPVVTTPMQFASVASVTVINVDEAYPP